MKKILARVHLLLVMLFAGSTIMMAQRQVIGVVYNSENETLPMANVVIKGTTVGTITDLDGQFSITVPNDSAILQFSFLGYEMQEFGVQGISNLKVRLVSEFGNLDEVVVIGYGVQKKENTTGAISMVTSKDLESVNANNMSKALQGRSAGVTIASTSGRPGAGVNIRVRGVGSINNDAQPIVVIDGIVSNTAALNELSPQDIETVSVLKDAASASIYGARSSNGVILVKTKSGSKGGPVVQFSAQMGVANMPKQIDIMSAQQYMDFYKSAYDSHNAMYLNDQRVMPTAYTQDYWIQNGQTSTDWQNRITQANALNQNYYLSVANGNDKSNFLFSVNYVEDNGILKNTYNNYHTVRLNSSHQLTNKIRIGENVSFTDKSNRVEADGYYWLMAAVSSPLMPVYNADNEKGYMGPLLAMTGANERTNPFAELMLNENINKNNALNSSFFAEMDLAKGLSFKTVLGLNYNWNQNTLWKPKYDLGQRSNPTANLRERRFNYRTKQWDQILNYATTVGDHSIGLMVGHTMEELETNIITGSANDFNWETLRTLNNGNPERNSATQNIYLKKGESYFGRLTYDYMQKYLFMASVRRDGSSRFGKNYRYGVFPALSFGWKISEDFLKDVKWIDILKLRFGYGMNGNEPDTDYLYDTFINGYDEHVYTLGDEERAIFGAAPFYSYGSPNLKWESSEMINVGLDLTAFKGKIQFTGEYYIKNQNDLITFLPLQDVYGLSSDANPPMVNLGDISNRGLELSLTYQNKARLIDYAISGNFSAVKNKVEHLPSNRIFNSSGSNVAMVNHSIGSYYGYVAEGILQESDFVADANGVAIQGADGKYTLLHASQETYTAPGDIKFKDINKDGVVNAQDQTLIGKIIPDFTYGLNINLGFKQFDLSAFFQGVYGADLYNSFASRANLASGNNQAKDENRLVGVNNYWTPENPVNDQTRIGLSDFNDNDRFSSWWLEDASFLRLRNLQVGYTIPRKLADKMNLKQLRVYIGGENLFTVTNYSGYDPEVSSEDPLGYVDDGKYPIPRILNVGLTVKF